MITESSLD